MKICPVCQRRYPGNTLYCPEDGAVVQEMTEAPVEESLIGKRLFGEYTVKQKLGEGGMGAVYLAQQDNIDQKIAVKVLHGRALKKTELLKRFVREAKAVSRLTHPNIIRVFIFGRTEEGLIYLAMEYVQGKSLRDALDLGPMEELRAIKIMKQVLSALGEAHELGIIHRDLKPDNIILTEYRGMRDFAKVLDFGIAKVSEPDGAEQQKLTQAGVVYGTPEYLSPEQAQAIELDHRSDLYSMGVILYEMMTGHLPFMAPSAVSILTMHVYEDPQPPSRLKADIDPRMEEIILKAIAKKPEERYPSAMAFFEALVEREDQILAEQGIKASLLWIPGAELLTSGPVAHLSRSGREVLVEGGEASGEAPTSSEEAPRASSGRRRQAKTLVYASVDAGAGELAEGDVEVNLPAGMSAKVVDEGPGGPAGSPAAPSHDTSIIADPVPTPKADDVSEVTAAPPTSASPAVAAADAVAKAELDAQRERQEKTQRRLKWLIVALSVIALMALAGLVIVIIVHMAQQG